MSNSICFLRLQFSLVHIYVSHIPLITLIPAHEIGKFEQASGVLLLIHELRGLLLIVFTFSSLRNNVSHARFIALIFVYVIVHFNDDNVEKDEQA